MATPVVMPKLGMVMAEGTVARWTRSRGEAVREGDVIAEIETEKISYELEATADGIVHPLVEEGATLPVDGLMGWLLADGEAPPSSQAPRPEAAPAGGPGAPPPARSTPPSARESGRPVVPSTPGARKLAAKLGVDLAAVAASGPAGRVTEADVAAFAERATAPAPAPTPSPSLPPGLPEPSESLPLSGMRRAIGEHMRASLATTAQLSFFVEVDVTEAQRRRREVSSRGEVRITFADLVMLACARALVRVPALNSRLSGGVVHRFDRVHIGLAVAMDDGVVVPVAKDVQAKDIEALAHTTRDLVLRARAGRLRPEELSGGTFSLSVLGQVDAFTPILNDGQTAILGVGRSVPKPAVKDGTLAVRELSTMSLSVDHQVVDGAHAGAFMRRLQQALERPANLFG